jgi:hypothetical protein
MPSAGAGAVSVTVPVDGLPANSDPGASVREARSGGATTSVAVFVTKTPQAAITSTEVTVDTLLVDIGNEADVAFAAMVTCAGIVAGSGVCLTLLVIGVSCEGGAEAVAWLESVITSPPEGAGPLIVTVPVELAPPPTLAGLRLRAVSVGGSTVRLTIFGGWLPACAEICADGGAVTTFGFIATGYVWAIKVAEIPPGGTTRPCGNAATAELLLRSATATPPDGAGWFRVTIPVT